jgi:hypothetical protein
MPGVWLDDHHGIAELRRRRAGRHLGDERVERERALLIEIFRNCLESMAR